MYILYKTDKASGKKVEVLSTKFFVQADRAIVNELSEVYGITDVSHGWKDEHPIKGLGTTWENEQVRYDIVEHKR